MFVTVRPRFRHYRKVKTVPFHTIQHWYRWSGNKTPNHASGTKVIRMIKKVVGVIVQRTWLNLAYVRREVYFNNNRIRPGYGNPHGRGRPRKFDLVKIWHNWIKARLMLQTWLWKPSWTRETKENLVKICQKRPTEILTSEKPGVKV